MFQDRLVMSSEDNIGTLVNFFNAFPAINGVDKAGRHPVAPLLFHIRFHVSEVKYRVPDKHCISRGSLNHNTLVTNGMTGRREHTYSRNDGLLTLDKFEMTADKWCFDPKYR